MVLVITDSRAPMDESRRRDIDKMRAKANDPSVSGAERKKAEEVLYVLKHQTRDPHVQQLRDKMRVATQNGDKARVEQLSEEGKKYDRDYRL